MKNALSHLNKSRAQPAIILPPPFYLSSSVMVFTSRKHYYFTWKVTEAISFPLLSVSFNLKSYVPG